MAREEHGGKSGRLYVHNKIVYHIRPSVSMDIVSKGEVPGRKLLQESDVHVFGANFLPTRLEKFG